MRTRNYYLTQDLFSLLFWTVVSLPFFNFFIFLFFSFVRSSISALQVFSLAVVFSFCPQIFAFCGCSLSRCSCTFSWFWLLSFCCPILLHAIAFVFSCVLSLARFLFSLFSLSLSLSLSFLFYLLTSYGPASSYLIVQKFVIAGVHNQDVIKTDSLNSLANFSSQFRTSFCKHTLKPVPTAPKMCLFDSKVDQYISKMVERGTIWDKRGKKAELAPPQMNWLYWAFIIGVFIPFYKGVSI